MKIFLLTSSLGAGGAERVATTLCNAWAKRGDTVYLIPTFSGGGAPFYQVSQEVNLVFLAEAVGAKKNKIFTYFKRLRYLRRLVQTHRPDVVVSFLPNVNVAAVLARSCLRVPLIICERSDPTVRPMSAFWSLACKLTYRYADMLTLQTAAASLKAAQLFPNVARIRSISNPLPVGVVSTEKVTGTGRKIMLSLGRLSPEKQVDRIIHAFAEAADTHPDWDLHVYGDGPEMPALSFLVKSLDTGNRIQLLGKTREPWEVLARSDAFVMSSRYEGFPNSLLEAMGIGLPCVAFDCPSGPREISVAGKFALLVPLNDQLELVRALDRLMGDPALRDSLGKSARDHVCSEFDLGSVIAQWDQLFREVRSTE